MTTLRLAVHVHSEWSYDGTWTLPRIAAAFRRRRYDAVLVCEHDRDFSRDRQLEHRAACAAASKGILLVPGIEYSDADNIVHVPVWGHVPFLGADRDTTDVLREVRAHDGAALLAHPSRHDAWARLDPAWSDLLSGIELWSRKYDGWSPNPRVVEGMDQHRLPAVASLDFHRRRQFAPLATVVHDVEGATEQAIVRALREARFTSTAMGLPIEWFTRGITGRTAMRLDAARARVAHHVRRVLP